MKVGHVHQITPDRLMGVCFVLLLSRAQGIEFLSRSSKSLVVVRFISVEVVVEGRVDSKPVLEERSCCYWGPDSRDLCHELCV